MTSIRFKMIYIFKNSSDLKLIVRKNIDAKYQHRISTQNINAKFKRKISS